MERSRKLALTNWTQANDALNQYFAGNKSELAKRLGMSRTTVTAFFKQEPLREAEFRKICFDLRLNWQLVSEVKSSAPQLQQEETGNPTPLQSEKMFEAILQRVRNHCRQKILSQHSRMRLLSGEEIGVDQLYVDVWLLNRPPHTFQISQSKLLETFDFRNDRLGLGDRIRRNTGFEIANKNPKLVILGKPGAGKTTFLKHLAVDWCKGQFQPELIAVLIEFRRIQDEHWYLLDALGKELDLNNGHQIRALKKQIQALEENLATTGEVQQRRKEIEDLWYQLNALPLQVLLTKGRFLILMDGLDEVPTDALRGEVQRQLYEITKEYSKNRFILTCRTQVMTLIPTGFTSVEVADFSPEQIQKFVQNWFVANGQSDTEAAQQWETLSNLANDNPALKELTVTPVLLSLMCLVLQDVGEIPSEMTWLYKKGIKLLLNRWNEDKKIAEWEMGSETYRQLSIEQKEELLIKIAARKFENPKNFALFEQEEISAEIAQFLKLAHPSEGVVVLKAIEAQHGLLIERADELWSFSHLTFQEHFTVQWLTQRSPKQLTEIISNSQWQRVMNQLVNSQSPADRLLELIKQAIDRSIANEPIVNQFLTWVFQKAESIQTCYRPAAIRAFYFVRALDHDHDHDHDLDFALALALALDLDLDLDLTRALALALDRAHALDLVLERDRDLALASALTQALDRVLNLALDYNTSKLVNEVEALRAALPKDSREILQWWKMQGIQWTKQLRKVMIEHRNIGHRWQFTDAQKQQLQRYYDTNTFLTDLMNTKGAVSSSVHTEIEDTLLLPWDELQRRQPEIYGQRQVE